MIFFDWKEYKRKFLFREIPIFKENENKNENDFLNFYLCHQYHYIVSSCFHFMTEKELREKHEHEMLKNNIRLFILLFAMMAFTYTVIVW